MAVAKDPSHAEERRASERRTADRRVKDVGAPDGVERRNLIVAKASAARSSRQGAR